MSIFSFFKSKDIPKPPTFLEEGNEVSALTSQLVNIRQPDVLKSVDDAQGNSSPDIPEQIFVEYEKPKTKPRMEPIEQTQDVNNLETLYRYLEQNHESKGYEDALMNPDTSYMQEQIQYLQNELNLIISRVTTYYRNYMRQIDFHIETRKRNEMVEMVDELLAHKASIEDEMKIVSSIQEDAKNSNGITQNVCLSYKRGFKNGFAAITYNTIFSRKG